MNTKTGFTVTECVIGLLVLTLAMTGMVGSFLSAKQGGMLADDRLRALHFARGNLEMLTTNTYDSSLLDVGAHTNWVTNVSVNGRVTNTFICSYTVTTTTYFYAKNIVLTNRWYNPPMAQTATVSLATSISSGFHW